MKTKLKTKTLGEVCDEIKGIIRTGPFGSQLHQSDYKDHGLPVVMPKDIVGRKISTESIARIGDEDVQRLSQHRLRIGDIVYGRRGDIGRCALIGHNEDGWLCGTGCLRISLGSSVLDSKFLYYYLGQSDVIEWISNQAIGSTLPNLNTSIIRSISVTYPLLRTQRKIADILSAYDRLIENNTRRIKILEEMAQLLYREWFVNFRFPGHEEVDLVESAIGLIPEGWEVVKAPDAILVNPKTVVPKEGNKPFVPMGCLDGNSMLIENIESRTGNSGAKFKNEDTLFARITPCLENGKTGYVQFLPSKTAVAFGSTEFIVLRSETLCPEFVYLMARSDRFRENAIKSMSGATGRQRVQEACFDAFFFAHPDKRTLSKFSKIISKMFRQIYILAQKNRNLRQTRDLLLPRLISGEIDIETLDLSNLDQWEAIAA
jgi:type I restriction enzyme, S subunit